MITQYNLYILK